MKYLWIILTISLVSCSSKKHLSYSGESNLSTNSKTEQEVNQVSGTLTSSVKEIEDSTETVIEITETDYTLVTDSVSGKAEPIPTKVKTTKQTTKKGSKSKTNSDSGTVAGSTTKDSTRDITEVKVKEELDKSSKFSNTAIERLIYLAIALILGSYIIIKKYFPSIFVKLPKFLRI